MFVVPQLISISEIKVEAGEFCEGPQGEYVENSL